MFAAIAGCGSSDSPVPSPSSDAGAASDAAARDSAAATDAGCDWGYSCNGGKCICTGGKLDNQSCADAPTCQKVCKTGC